MSVRSRFVILVILVMTAFFVFVKIDIGQEYLQKKIVGGDSVSTTTQSVNFDRLAPSGYVNYSNKKYRFSIFYPNELKVSEYDEGANTSTVTLESLDGTIGFQIFVVPYGEQQITDKQFKKDVPTGVREDVKETKIGNVLANSFYSRNDVIGDTFEVWFIHNGYLFEVTTIRSLESWLVEILKSWVFVDSK